ncbi:hypothetical protein [Anabaena azotica]|uniref:hypothetical protein n=1 Tax=Anabaena azotica TaxID=197653 RepID=UPI0039A75F5A
MQSTPYKIQPQIGKNLLLAILLTFSSGQWYCTSINKAWTAQLETKKSQTDLVSNITYFALADTNQQSNNLSVIYLEVPPNIETVSNKTDFALADTNQQDSNLSVIYLETPPNIESANIKQQSDIVQLEFSADRVARLSSQSTEALLNPKSPQSMDDKEEIQHWISQKQGEAEQSTEELNEEQELQLRVRPRPLENILTPLPQKPAVQFQPIGYLRGYLGYFQTNNIFSTNDEKIEDGLIFSGLTLASAYFPVGERTYINGSIDGSLIRYLDQSEFDYNQVRFNLGIYQELSPVMYAELNLSNQQSFYANNSDFFAAGDRFLNENSIQLSLGRRDTLTNNLIFDSFYELSANFSDPERRSRIVNTFWLSLSYYLQNPLQVGLNYQLNLSDFTEQDREDQFHRVFGHINYRASDTSNVYLQGGLNFGGSTTPNIDFSGWFFSVNYGFEIGRF